jgi:hypothetical protein
MWEIQYSGVATSMESIWIGKVIKCTTKKTLDKKIAWCPFGKKS